MWNPRDPTDPAVARSGGGGEGVLELLRGDREPLSDALSGHQPLQRHRLHHLRHGGLFPTSLLLCCLFNSLLPCCLYRLPVAVLPVQARTAMLPVQAPVVLPVHASAAISTRSLGVDDECIWRVHEVEVSVAAKFGFNAVAVIQCLFVRRIPSFVIPLDDETRPAFCLAYSQALLCFEHVKDRRRMFFTCACMRPPVQL